MGLKSLRNELDSMNAEIANIISRRMIIVRKIAKYKREYEMEIVDENRQSDVIENFEDEFENRGMSKISGKIIANALIRSAVEEEHIILDCDVE